MGYFVVAVQSVRKGMTMSADELTLLLGQGRRHEHSGRLGTAPLIAPIAGLVLAIVLGVSYGFATAYNPLHGIFTLALAVLCGLGVAFGTSWTCLWAHCRAPAFLVTVTFLVALGTLYCIAATFVLAVLQREGNLAADDSLLGFVLNPARIWHELVAINGRGWQLRASKATGLAAWAQWFAETLIILTVATFFARDTTNQRVFCERCGQWARLHETLRVLTPPETPEDRARLESGDLSPLATLSIAEADTTPTLRLDAWVCGKCSETTALAVFEVKATKTRHGRTKTAASQLGGPVDIPRALYTQLGGRGHTV